MSPAPTDGRVREAVAVLWGGGLVAFPTETVYGLGADATNADAVRRVFAVKGRPVDHPLIVHVASAAALDALAAEVPSSARALADAFWPGPCTLVVELREGAVVGEAVAGRSTVAVRVPDHPIALAILSGLGRPIVAPSANRFGAVSPTRAEHVRADLGHAVDLVVDGGPCAVGVESTIVDCTGALPVVRRLGGVTEDALASVLGATPARSTEAPGVSGTLPSHYAPAARVHVVAAAELDETCARLTAAGRRVGVIAPQGTSASVGAPASVAEHLVVLGQPADDAGYARGLYLWLRAGDDAGLDDIVAVAPTDSALGAAVRDRLRRASHS